MRIYSKTTMLVLASAWLASAAQAEITNVKDLKDGAPVMITGMVDSVQNEREFTLRDKSGTIGVEIASNQSVVLKQGDTVSVTGTYDKGFILSEIDASKVVVNKNFAQAVGDTIESRTSISFEGATSYTINTLPKEGLVKVSGIVTDVDNEKKFTMQDASGKIDVAVDSPETAALAKGAEVTVIGYVQSGMLGKDISAHKVLVVTDTASR